MIDHGSLFPIPHILLFTLHYTVYSYNKLIHSVDTRLAILYRMDYTPYTPYGLYTILINCMQYTFQHSV